ncbi:MAG: hypothetical protein ABSB35_25465, partial [Bryobacteraceae bacterium]
MLGLRTSEFHFELSSKYTSTYLRNGVNREPLSRQSEKGLIPRIWCRLSRKRGGIGRDSRSNQNEAGAAVHLSVDGLQSVNLSFHLAAALSRVEEGRWTGTYWQPVVSRP